MVYRGRPSAACGLCRKRRIKCDKVKPGCTQCARMYIDCPGYASLLDQKFRDESASVVKKAEKSYKSYKTADLAMSKRSDCSSPKIACAAWLFAPDTASTSTFDVFHNFQSVEDTAVAHLMSCFIPSSHFNYLPWMYGQAGTDCPLVASIHAASMAYLSRELKQSGVTESARRLYAKALVVTNRALADPHTAVSDSTLISVLLLGLFEALVWTYPRTPESWATHTQGALEIVKLRGTHQLNSLVGRQLFLQVTNIICVNSLQRRSKVPQDLMDLIQGALPELEYGCESPQYELASLTCHVSNLIAEIHAGGMDAEEVLEGTRIMDQQYVSFADRLPPAWHYLEVSLEELRPGVYAKIIHQYPSHRTSQLWNSCRMIRILLNEAIHAYAACLPTVARQITQREAVANIEEMTTQICASVPQFADQLASSTSVKASTAPLLWPLSAVRGASLASEHVRMYAVDRLRILGGEAQISQAEKIAREDSGFDALQDGLHMFYMS